MSISEILRVFTILLCIIMMASCSGKLKPKIFYLGSSTNGTTDEEAPTRVTLRRVLSGCSLFSSSQSVQTSELESHRSSAMPSNSDWAAVQHGFNRRGTVKTTLLKIVELWIALWCTFVILIASCMGLHSIGDTVQSFMDQSHRLVHLEETDGPDVISMEGEFSRIFFQEPSNDNGSGNLFSGLGNVGPMSPPKNSLSSNELLSMIKKGSQPTSSPLTSTDGTGAPSQSPSKKPTRQEDFGMLGLSEIIRTAHTDRTSLALGLDSEGIIMGLSSAVNAVSHSGDLGNPRGHKVMLLKSMTSPWAMETAANPTATSPTTAAAATSWKGMNQTNLEAILPACYNVQAPPHASSRIGSFTEETLFYMFYGMPRDRMQEMAARELTVNRGWRFHKELRIWVLPSSATSSATASMTAGISNLRMSPAPVTGKGPHFDNVFSSSSKAAHTPVSNPLDGDDTASYIIFDPTSWSKLRKELPIVKEEMLEDRFGATSPTISVSSNAAPVASPTLSVKI